MAGIPAAPALALSSATGTAGGVPVSLDPRLQKILAMRRRGQLIAASATRGVDEAAIVAKVTDLGKWEGLSEVTPGAVVGGKGDDGTYIVTGRIPVTRIENVRNQPFVVSLKGAQILRPMLDKTVEEIGARPDLLPPGNLTDGGAGVVVGIVDYGADFVHQNFRTAAGGTRFSAIWHQGGPSNPSSPFGYGRLYTPDDINAALQQSDPYAALGYGPAPDSPFSVGTHGTHVADIAVGNGRGSNVAGVAPNAELIFVDISHSLLPWTGPGVVGSTFGDSTQLLDALTWIFERAGDRPCVINVSLGTNGGPHDGSTLVEQGIDRLVRAAPNRAVVIAASNAYDDGIHAAGQVPQGGTADLSWDVPVADFSHNEMEIWFDGRDRFAVELLAPGGTSLGQVGPGQNGSVTDSAGQVVIYVANRLNDPNNGDNMIGIFLESGQEGGHWTVRLHGEAIGHNGRFHAWIERDNSNPSQFAPPHDNSHTIGSISCGHESIVVGSYDAHKTTLPISFFSSAGPTRDGRQKPEVSAPGHAVHAAHSRTRTGTTRKSGTSMAAPATAGVVALMMAQARAQGRPLSIQEIRQVLIDTARRNPPSGTAWHDRYGHGRVSAREAIEAVSQLAPPPAPAEKKAAKKAAKKSAKRKSARKKITRKKTTGKRK